MANDNTTYIINPTDVNSNREFNISPYTTNGNISPVNPALDDNAISSNSSLLLYGKGSPNYGDRLQENLYHLLENFANPTEPLNPLKGQLWYDTNDNTLKVFNSSALSVYDIDLINNFLVLKINGNKNSKYFDTVKAAILLRFSALRNPGVLQFNIFNGPVVINKYISSDSIATSSTSYNPTDPNIDNLISIDINNYIGIVTEVGDGILTTIGTWDNITDPADIILDGTEFETYNARMRDLNLADNRITNLDYPVDMFDGVNLAYLPIYMNTLGISLIGNVTTVSNDVEFLNMVTFSNSNQIIPGNVTIFGNVITGLTDPIDPTNAVNLGYLETNYLLNSTDTMDGTLSLAYQPQQNGISGTKDITHAATVGYVDDEISNVVLGIGGASLSALNDVTITTPLNTNTLIFNTTSNKWENAFLNFNDLGDVTLGALFNDQFIQYNTSTSTWENNTISINSLDDVTITTPIDDDILVYTTLNGWENKPLTLNGFLDTDFIKTTGGTIVSGVLSLNTQPGQNGEPGLTDITHAATIGYVDDLMSGISADTYVQSGNFDIFTGVLTLSKNIGPDVTIFGLSTVYDSNTLIHTNIETLVNNGDFIQQVLIKNPAYPQIPLNEILSEVSIALTRLQHRNISVPFISDGRSTSYDVTVIDDVYYTVGYDSIQIYVNGAKLIANKAGYQKISALDPEEIYPGNITNIPDDITTYSFDITVDGILQTITVIGENVQDFESLKNEINLVLLNARCILENGFLKFISSYAGASSSINIVDVDLFSTAIISHTILAAKPGIDFDYSEIGPYGYTLSSEILFNVTIPVSDVIEFVILSTGGAIDNNNYEI